MDSAWSLAARKFNCFAEYIPVQLPVSLRVEGFTLQYLS